MDQKTLYDLEALCIQEWAPFCEAACPLHFDARGLMTLTRNENIADACKLLRKLLPLAGVLARICDAPCRARCKRIELDEAVLIGGVERACIINEPTTPKAPLMPPATKQAIAVINSGLSSLTVVQDLRRKGFKITIFEPSNRLGGSLWQLNDELLPKDILQAEIELVIKNDVSIKYNADITAEDFLNETLGQFAAIYAGLDNAVVPPECNNIQNIDETDAMPQAYRNFTGIFGGGYTKNDNFSPAFAAAQGRWAATSIARLVTETSMQAGRIAEKPYTTKLYTSLDEIAPKKAAPITDAFASAVAEAKRCILCECMECVKRCTFMREFDTYPKKAIRGVYNNETTAYGLGYHQANKFIVSCTLCELCTEICPHAFPMAQTLLTSRQTMVTKAYMPPPAFEFAVTDMQYANGELAAFWEHAPGKTYSKYAFYPGCQMGASMPDKVKTVYQYLRDNVEPETGLVLGCCGAPALWSGRQKLFTETLAELQAAWLEKGRPTLILACTTCKKIYDEYLPELPTIMLWEIMAEQNLKTPAGVKAPLAVHDACTSRHMPKIQQSVRKLLQKMNLPFEELKYSGLMTKCCGFGGLVTNSNPQLAAKFAKDRAAESDLDYVASCVMCRDNLVKNGKRVWHLLDLLFPEDDAETAVTRPMPDISARRDNRFNLKTELLKDLWHMQTPAAPFWHDITVELAPDLKTVLDQRRILIEDLQQILAIADKEQLGFINEENGHVVASLKIGNVTFWIEYMTLAENKFAVFNAYTHRMEITN